jgi:translocation and assembly module TamB
VPVTGAMLGRDKALQNLVAGTTIPVPIGGTLSHPKPDRRALGAALKEVSKSIFKRGAEQEANELLKRLTGERGNLRPRQ